MKSDLPRLMRERNLDAIVVNNPDGLGASNAAFNYFIGDAHVSTGWVVVKSSGEMILAHRTMERDEAAATGMQLVNLDAYNFKQLLADKNGDRLAAEVERSKRLFADLGVNGRVGFYGADQQGHAFQFLSALAREEICEVVTEPENDVIDAARMTKDEREVEQIRMACRLTEEVIGATRDFICQHTAQHETLIKSDGTPLTVGDIKRFIRLRSAELELEEANTIFAIGRDAGVPHSRGTAGDPIQLGKSIVFDIFPRLLHGYHADITRTWCVGYAPDHIAQAHAQVAQVHRAIEQMFDTRRAVWEYQEETCRLFEQMGHPTIRTNSAITSGYVHAQGHGFGLSVHEPPVMRNKGMATDEKLQVGTIICNEPGLYYPDDPRGGWGVRIEDDYWCNREGVFERLTHFPHDLVVPLN